VQLLKIGRNRSSENNLTSLQRHQCQAHRHHHALFSKTAFVNIQGGPKKQQKVYGTIILSLTLCRFLDYPVQIKYYINSLLWQSLNYEQQSASEC